MIKCKNCGADTRFDINRQLLVCDYCDSTFEVENVSHSDITSEEQIMEAVVHTCPQCGAELYTTEDTAATFCSYCGSSVLLESRLVMVNKPDFIIPFSITKEEAEAAYKRMLSKAVFAPSNLKKAEIDSIRGIYMPYWEYYIKDNSEVTVRGEANSRRKGNYIYSDVYNVSFKTFIESDGLEYDASSKFPDDLSQACAPYYFKESKLFNPGYMSGFYADLGDTDPHLYTSDAVQVVKKIAAEEISSNSNIGRYGVLADDIEKSLGDYDATPGLAMYPVWFASARDKQNKYINYAVINGQTGRASADLPVDKKKILLGMLILAIPIFLLLYFLFTPNPHATVIIVGILAVIGTLIGKTQLKGIGGYDKGAGKTKNELTEEEAALKKTENTWMTIRLIAVIAICALTIITDPVSDIYYYAASIISGILCGITYWRLFELHNRRTLRPLPQLEKRGGNQ